MRIATAGVRTGFAMTVFLQGVSARLGGGVGAPRPTDGLQEVQWGGPMWASAPTKDHKKCGWAGRCGERTERCQWQKQRSERVAAVKISSVRRKAAQKFWAPQQGHRPLRKRILWCVGEGLCPSRGRPQGSPLRRITRGAEKESPSHGFAVPASFRQGGHGDGGCGLPQPVCAPASQ